MTLSSDPSVAQPAFYACVDAALSHAGSLMRGLVAAVRDVLYQQSRQQLQGQGMGILSEARSLLGRHGPVLVAEFPESLCAAMAGVQVASPADHDGLQEMGDVMARPPEQARARQALAHAVQDTLPLFTALVSAARGMPAADPAHNPLLPDTYLRALHIVVDGTGVPAAVQALWMEQFHAVLGPQLASEYTHLSDGLRAAGVVPAGAEGISAEGAPVALAQVVGQPAAETEFARDAEFVSEPSTEPRQTPSPARQWEATLDFDLDFDLADGEMDDDPVVDAAAETDVAPTAEPPVEDRAAMAQRIASDIAAWPEMADVAQVVRDFVLGPWARVIAESQLQAGDGPLDREGYYALVRPLLWSSRPELGRADVDRLVHLVPSLLSRLRAGLRSIDHPREDEDAFVAALGELHRIAARPPGSSFQQRRQPRGDTAPPNHAALRAASPAAPANVPAAAADVLATGAWVESLERGRWIRLQLSWVSPHRNLLLFTADDGSTESMTRRVCLQRMAERRLRILPDLDLDTLFS